MKKRVRYSVEARYDGGKWALWSSPTTKRNALISLRHARKTSIHGDGFEYQLVQVTETRRVVKG